MRFSRIPNKEEIGELLGLLPSPGIRAAVVLAAFSGLRAANLQSLALIDLDAATATLSQMNTIWLIADYPSKTLRNYRKVHNFSRERKS